MQLAHVYKSVLGLCSFIFVLSELLQSEWHERFFMARLTTQHLA